jgi:hypothetical protein
MIYILYPRKLIQFKFMFLYSLPSQQTGTSVKMFEEE